MKSGEDVISDAQEVRDKEGNSIIAYYLRNPYVMELTTIPIEDDELTPEDTSVEDQPRVKISVSYTPTGHHCRSREIFTFLQTGLLHCMILMIISTMITQKNILLNLMMKLLLNPLLNL